VRTIVNNFNTPLSSIDSFSRPKKSTKKSSELNCIMYQANLTDIYRTLHQTTAKYIFFSKAHENFFKMHHILDHKASLNKYKKTEIISCILTDHNRVKLDINSKMDYTNYINAWRLNNMLFTNQWATEEIRL
jgi:hypothetical protein